jgi:hypothetical protein
MSLRKAYGTLAPVVSYGATGRYTLSKEKDEGGKYGRDENEFSV